MAGQLSALNLIAGAGILGGVGGVPIAANACAIINISTFTSLAVESQYANIKTSGNSALSSSTMNLVCNLANATFPVLTNSVPANYISTLGNTTVSGFTSLITRNIANIIGSDLGQFQQILNTAEAYITTNNLFINSAVNANNASENATYISQNNTITGGLSQVTQAFSALGQDLLALGAAIDLENLPNLGSPQELLVQISAQSGSSSELNTALINAGISQAILNNIDIYDMTDEQQKIVFDVMSNTTGSVLAQVLKILRVTTPGIETLADLLNPVKAFPKSFNTLTAPTSNGLRAIYINSSGVVNTNLETELPSNVLAPVQGYQTVKNTYVQLKKIIPPDWALANKALQAGLQQVKSIFNSTIQSLGTASTGLESTRGMDLINALTHPLPTEVYNYYLSSFVTGSGKNGTLLLADVLGTAGGWVINDALSGATNIISSMSNAGTLTILTNSSNGVFTVMQNAINGDYDIPLPSNTAITIVQIPAGLPAEGDYDTLDLAFTGNIGHAGNATGIGLIPAATSLIGTIVSNNTTNVTTANSYWNSIAAQIILEHSNQSKAGLFGNVVSGQSPTGLVTSLPGYGLDTSLGGVGWYMSSVANTSTLGGQAIVSSLRESRNQVLLQTAGIQTDIIVDDTVDQPQANILVAGQYTASEAANQKII